MQPHPDTSCPPSHLPFMKETGIVRFPPECGPSTVTAEVKVPSEGRLTPGQGGLIWNSFPSSSFVLGFVGEVETLSCQFSVPPTPWPTGLLKS